METVPCKKQIFCSEGTVSLFLGCQLFVLTTVLSHVNLGVIIGTM